MTGSLDNLTRRIRDKVSLAALIGESVKLTARSRLPTGCCPFHADSSPSFVVYPDRYFCFGCKASGDVIEFVRKSRGLGFIEAVRFLTEKYQIEAPELDEARGSMSRQKENSRLFQMMAEAQDFFRAQLQQPRGATATAYLTGRGFTAENITKFGFGLTPDEPFGLTRHLRGRGYRDQEMTECSLATVSSRDGKTYDFFRHRIMLPIHDSQGRIIGFGGRTLDNNPAKYLNSRETRLFDKSRTLFGFDRARQAIRDSGRAIVTEGYMDVLQLWQQGIPEAVACLGTALTEYHLRLLRHATSNVFLVFDGDKAGRGATLGAVSVALTVPDVRVRAVQLPDGEDPDSFVRKHGREQLTALLDSAQELLDFAVRAKLSETHDLAIPDLVRNEFVPWLSRVPDRMQQGYLMSRIARLTGLSVATLESELRGVTSLAAPGIRRSVQETSPAREGAEARPAPRRLRALTQMETELLAHTYFARPSDVNPEELRAFAHSEMTLEPEHQEFFEELLDCLERGLAPREALGPVSPAQGHPSVLALRAHLDGKSQAFSTDNRKDCINRVMAMFRRDRIRATIRTLTSELGRLESIPEATPELNQVLKTITELSRELRSLEQPRA